MPTAPGHPFYKRLNEILDKTGFDDFCEASCAGFYHARLGRPSLAPGLYFRIMIDRVFRGAGQRARHCVAAGRFAHAEAVSVHRTGREHAGPCDDLANAIGFSMRLSESSHGFPAGAGRADQGRTIGVDSTTLEANAAMKSRAAGYGRGVHRLSGSEALRRMDRKRRKKTSNEDWQSPSDGDAEITKLKDGRTALAYKAENGPGPSLR